MGGKTSTSTSSQNGTSTTTLSPEVKAAYNSVLSQFGGLSNTSASNPTISSAEQGIGSLAGTGSGAFNAASNSLASAATPTSQTVNGFLSPYLQNVLQTSMASQNEQNAEQQQGVIGNAIAKGALGGNRVSVAQGELQRQNDIANNATNAGILNSGYQSAMSAAQAQQQNDIASAQAGANLGSTQMATGLAQQQALLGAGQYDQTSKYSNLGTLAATAAALSNSGQTVTTKGTTSQTQPAGNVFSSLLGAGLGIASLFKDGGSVRRGYDSGGVIPYYAQAAAPPAFVPTLPQVQQQSDPFDKYTQDAEKKGLQNIGSGIKGLIAPKQASTVPLGESDFDPSGGGSGGLLSGLGKLFGFAEGGAVRGYDDGGTVDPYSLFDDPNYFTTPSVALDKAPSGVVVPVVAKASIAPVSGVVAPPPLDPPVNVRELKVASVPKDAPSSGDLSGLFQAATDKYGLPADYLPRTAQIESGMNPDASNGSAEGLFQFTPATAKQYGLLNPRDPAQSTDKAAELAADNRDVLANRIGRDPTSGELYLAHQQGAGGAAALLNHPRDRAADIIGIDRVVQNLPDALKKQAGNMTAAEFAQLWTGRFDGTDPTPTGGIVAAANDSAPNAGQGLVGPRGIDIPDVSASPTTNSGLLSHFGHGNPFGLSDDARMGLLAAGLGIMGGTSPNALTNIGTGGLQGVTAYQERRKMDRENALAQSGINAQQLEGQRLALEAKRTAAQIALETAQTGATRYPATVTPAGILTRDTTQPDQNPRLVPFSSLTSGPSGASDTAGGSAPTTPAGSSALPGFTTEPPAQIPTNPMLVTDMGQRIVAGQTEKDLDGAKTAFDAAQSTKMQVSQMRELVKDLPQDGILSQGAGLQARAGIVKHLNAALSIIGQPPIDPNAIGSIEDLNKLSTRLGFDLSKSIGSHEAGFIVNEALSAVPNADNTPAGFEKIATGIEAAAQRQSDYYEFLSKWAQKTGGDTTGAAAYFNQQNPPEKYLKAFGIIGNSNASPAVSDAPSAAPAAPLRKVINGKTYEKDPATGKVYEVN